LFETEEKERFNGVRRRRAPYYKYYKKSFERNMKTKILSILMISLLILSFVGAEISTTVSEVSQGQVIKVIEGGEVSQGQVIEITERCYSNRDCEDILMCATASLEGYNYESFSKCNFTTGECYCEMWYIVDYNEKFTLKKGEKIIIPGRYFIVLEDIYGICKMSDYCYPIAKLWYFTHDPSHTFYMEEGDTKNFGDNIIPAPEEKSILKLLKIENNEATFIVYPTYEVTVNVTEINVTVKQNPQLTAEVVKIDKECEGCILDNKCLPIGYRTSDQYYCDADKSLENQKQEDENCNNNFECESNVCVGANCVSGGLIQKILDFFKKLFGL